MLLFILEKIRRSQDFSVFSRVVKYTIIFLVFQPTRSPKLNLLAGGSVYMIDQRKCHHYLQELLLGSNFFKSIRLCLVANFLQIILFIRYQGEQYYFYSTLNIIDFKQNVR